MEPKQRQLAAYVQYVENFNHSLKVLTRDLARRHPSDALIDRAHKRVMTAIAIDPLFVINSVGPYLYSYRAQIYNLSTPDGSAESFFLENSFDNEIKASVDQNKADMVSYIIPKAKECARTLPPGEKQEYKNLVIAMLDEYIEYLAETRA
jgi:hypothetical protein